MSPLSRRGFLFAAASAGVLAPAAHAAAASPTPAPVPSPSRVARGYYVPPPGAAAPSVCVPTTAPPAVLHATGTLGSVTATVNVRTLKDVVALRYQLTNNGGTQNTYVVSYTDQATTFSSRAIPLTLDPGGQYDGVLYGSLDHEFLFHVDLPDGTTLTLGPLNRAPSCVSSRKQRMPLYQPSARSDGKSG